MSKLYLIFALYLMKKLSMSAIDRCCKDI